MILRFSFFLVSGLLLLPLPGHSTRAEGVNSSILAQIPQRTKSFVDAQTVGGTVRLVFHGTEVVELDALGMADIEAGHRMQKDTIFQIMSMSPWPSPVWGSNLMGCRFQ